MGVEPVSGGKVGTATRRECLDNTGPVRRSAVPRTEELEQNVGLGREVRRRLGRRFGLGGVVALAELGPRSSTFRLWYGSSRYWAGSARTRRAC